MSSARIVFSGYGFDVSPGAHQHDIVEAFDKYIAAKHDFVSGINLLNVMAQHTPERPELVRACELLANNLWVDSAARAQASDGTEGEDERFIIAKVMAKEVADDKVHEVWEEVLAVENVDMLKLRDTKDDAHILHAEEILTDDFKETYEQYKHEHDAEKHPNALAYVLKNH